VFGFEQGDVLLLMMNYTKIYRSGYLPSYYRKGKHKGEINIKQITLYCSIL
jgi:hypothetical protein